MTAVSFYHLERSPLDQALPKLLEKTLEAGKRAVVIVASSERLESLNALLWTYDPNSWMPHGGAKEGHPDKTPVWLTTDDENPNGAQFLFLADGATSRNVEAFERCFELFDGHDGEAVAAARTRWKTYKESGFDLTYWQQNDRGGWERKG